MKKRIICHLTNNCNFNCKYCNSKNKNNPIIGLKLSDIYKINNYLTSTNDQWTFILSGGEPLLHPDFIEICKTITKNHFLSLNTNLSINSNVKMLVDNIDPNRVDELLISSHIEERIKNKNLNEFIENLLFLKNNGFKYKVTFILYPTLLKKYIEAFRLLKLAGITLIPVAYRGIFENKNYPLEYDLEAKNILRDFNGIISENIPYNFMGILCKGGKDFIRIRENGTCSRCPSNSHDAIIGNAKDGFILFNEYKPCNDKICHCSGSKLIILNDEQKSFMNGMKFYLSNQIDEAIEEFYNAVKIHEKPSNVFNNLGVLYSQKNEYNKANEYFRKAYELNPVYKIYALNYCNSLHQLNKTDESLNVLEDLSNFKNDDEIKELITKIKKNFNDEIEFKLCVDFIPITIEDELNIDKNYFKLNIIKNNGYRISIGKTCNNQCGYCNVFGIKNIYYTKSMHEIIKEISDLKKLGENHIYLPCNFDIRNDALEILEKVKDEKIKIILESNGRIFYYKNKADRFSKFVDVFRIFINGNEDIHNEISGNNSFSQTLAGINNLLKSNANVEIVTLLSKSNINILDHIILKSYNFNIFKLNIIVLDENLNLLSLIINKIKNIKTKKIFNINIIRDSSNYNKTFDVKTIRKINEKKSILFFANISPASGITLYLSNIIKFLSTYYNFSIISSKDFININFIKNFKKNNANLISMAQSDLCHETIEKSDIIYVLGAGTFINFFHRTTKNVLEAFKLKNNGGIFFDCHPDSKKMPELLNNSISDYFNSISYTCNSIKKIDSRYLDPENKMKHYVLYNPVFDKNKIIKKYESKKFLRIGKLSRDNIDKYSSDTLEFYEFLNKIGNLKFIFMGGKKTILSLLKNKPVPDNWLLYEEDEISKHDFFNQIDLFLYKTNEDYKEYFGNVIIEAMYNGIPVITENRDAYPEQIKHGKTGYLCKNNIDFYKYVDLLKNYPLLREKIGKNAQSYVNMNFNIESFIEKHLEVFTKILKQ